MLILFESMLSDIYLQIGVLLGAVVFLVLVVCLVDDIIRERRGE